MRLRAYVSARSNVRDFISCACILLAPVNPDPNSTSVISLEDIEVFRNESTYVVPDSTLECDFMQGSVSVLIKDDKT